MGRPFIAPYPGVGSPFNPHLYAGRAGIYADGTQTWPGLNGYLDNTNKIQDWILTDAWLNQGYTMGPLSGGAMLNRSHAIAGGGNLFNQHYATANGLVGQSQLMDPNLAFAYNTLNPAVAQAMAVANAPGPAQINQTQVVSGPNHHTNQINQTQIVDQHGNPIAPEGKGFIEKVASSGGYTLGGALVGGAIGLIGGPPGVILGAKIGAGLGGAIGLAKNFIFGN